MSDLIRLRIAPTSLQRLSETLVSGVPVWDEEEGALYIHDGSTAGGVPAMSSGGFVPQYKTLTASTADNETLYWRPKTTGNTYNVSVATGTGTFTKKVILSRETRADGASTGDAVAGGTRFTLLVQFTTTSASRVIEVRENSATGDVLDTFSSDTEGTFTASAEYAFTGSAWVKLWSRIHA